MRKIMLMLALTVSLAMTDPAWAASTYYDSHENPFYHVYLNHHEHPVAYCSDGAVAEWYGYDHYQHQVGQYMHEWHPEAGAHDSHLSMYYYPTDDHYRHTHINQTCPGV